MIESEGVSLLALRFDDSIREIDDRVAFFEIGFDRAGLNLRADAEGKRRKLDGPRTFSVAQQVRIQMTGIRVANRSAVEIENRERQSHERSSFR